MTDPSLQGHTNRSASQGKQQLRIDGTHNPLSFEGSRQLESEFISGSRREGSPGVGSQQEDQEVRVELAQASIFPPDWVSVVGGLNLAVLDGSNCDRGSHSGGIRREGAEDKDLVLFRKAYLEWRLQTTCGGYLK